jgi:CRP-like cAMP-binding protein
MPLHTLEPIISEHPFFQGLPERYLKFVVGCAKNVRFDEGTVLLCEGDEANRFYLIREGLVALEVAVPQRGEVTLQTIGAGDVLGWSWLFPPYRSHFGARTLQATRALEFDGKCLRNKCEEDHDLGYELIKRAAGIMRERLRATRLQLLDLYATHA